MGPAVWTLMVCDGSFALPLRNERTPLMTKSSGANVLAGLPKNTASAKNRQASVLCLGVCEKMKSTHCVSEHVHTHAHTHCTSDGQPCHIVLCAIPGPPFPLTVMKKMRPSEARPGWLPVADRKGKWGRRKRRLQGESRARDVTITFNLNICVRVCVYFPFKSTMRNYEKGSMCVLVCMSSLPSQHVVMCRVTSINQ